MQALSFLSIFNVMHSRISAQNQYKDRFNKWLYSAEQTATTAQINHATQKIDSGLVLMAIKSVILGELAGNQGPARWQHFLPFHIRAKPLIAKTGMRVALSKLKPLVVSNRRRHRQ